MTNKTKPKYNIGKIIKTNFLITIGAIVAGFALSSFLSPNEMIDGGIIGISMIISYLSKINLGLLILILNFPFICIAWKKMGTKFVLQTLYANLVLAFAVNFFQAYSVTKDLLLATVFGGIVLGLGVGVILKNEGSLDGTEIVALIISKRFGLSVGEFILTLNVFIYAVAGLAFGWERAMYSVLVYFIASKVIDAVMEGFNSSKSVRIISDNAGEIGSALIDRLNISITYLQGIGGYTGEDKDIIYCVISRIELPKMLEIVKEIDKKAFVSVVDVHDVYGGRFKTK